MRKYRTPFNISYGLVNIAITGIGVRLCTADAAVLPASLNNSPVTCRFDVREYGSRSTSYAVAPGQVEQ